MPTTPLNWMTVLAAAVACISFTSQTPAQPAAEPTSSRRDAWRDQKFGMFIHWGLYSIPAGVWNDQPVTRGYSEQIQMWANIPHNQYAKLADQFNPVQYNPDAIVKLAKSAGMSYLVITSKHHDGFAMFDTKQSDYDIVDATPYGKDALKELAEACRRHDMKLGFYFSLVDWRAGHAFDPNNNNPLPMDMEPMILGQLEELLTNYGEIVQVWFDMSSPTAEQSKRFADTVHRLQPNCMVSGRVGNNQGDFIVMGDNQLSRHVIAEPWQTPASIYHATWGYRSWQKREDLPDKVRELTRNLVNALSKGGGFLLNIGPRGDGSIVEFESDVLHGIGRWMDQHREAIDDVEPFRMDPVDWGVVTHKPGVLYLHVFEWMTDRRVVLPGLGHQEVKRAYALNDEKQHALTTQSQGVDLIVALPEQSPDAVLPVIAVEFADQSIDAVLSTDVFADTQQPLKSIEISRDQIIDHFSRAGGDYYDQKQTVVKQSVRFTPASPRQHRVFIVFEPGDFTAPVVVDCAGKQFTVTLDGRVQDKIVDGRIVQEVGGLELQADQRYELSVRRHQPDYRQQDIGATIVGFRIEPPKR